MSSEKTRLQLIAAAKRVFIREGYENTTMSDIANESGNGRRTLYMYFDSKVEIYQAVINLELQKIIDALNEISAKDIPPQQKIVEVIYGRMTILKEAVYRNGTLRSGFFRDIWSVQHFRKDFDSKEKKILMNIILEGKTCGVFNVQHVNLMATYIQYCLKGFEVPFIRGQVRLGHSGDEVREEIQKMIYGALGYNEKPE
ncbi:MAG: TetR/AcrR family transcriptional regulator [Bacteroidaceae bacterium]|nr:TetR/AcrR family transcriptional regulator [Bacteroidaceae bacterium]